FQEVILQLFEGRAACDHVTGALGEFGVYLGRRQVAQEPPRRFLLFRGAGVEDDEAAAADRSVALDVTSQGRHSQAVAQVFGLADVVLQRGGRTFRHGDPADVEVAGTAAVVR